MTGSIRAVSDIHRPPREQGPEVASAAGSAVGVARAGPHRPPRGEGWPGSEGRIAMLLPDGLPVNSAARPGTSTRPHLAAASQFMAAGLHTVDAVRTTCVEVRDGGSGCDLQAVWLSGWRPAAGAVVSAAGG